MLGSHFSFSRRSPKKLLATIKETGATACAVFLKSPRSNKFVALFDDKIVAFFRDEIAPICRIFAHASYTYNIAASNNRDNNIAAFYHECELANQLRIPIVIHPGFIENGIVADGITNVVAAINYVHARLPQIEILVEFCGDAPITKKGSASIGINIGHIKKIINKVHISTRVGVCLDTCHMYVAGIDMNDTARIDAFMAEFDAEIGATKLCLIHLNNTEEVLGSCKDHHSPLARGNITGAGFKHFLRHTLIRGVPIVTETHLDGNAAIKNELKYVETLLQ